jgi:hypothetical protein
MWATLLKGSTLLNAPIQRRQDVHASEREREKERDRKGFIRQDFSDRILIAEAMAKKESSRSMSLKYTSFNMVLAFEKL